MGVRPCFECNNMEGTVRKECDQSGPVFESWRGWRWRGRGGWGREGRSVGKEQFCQTCPNRPFPQSLFGWVEHKTAYVDTFFQIFQYQISMFLIFPSILTQIKVSSYPDLLETVPIFRSQDKYFALLSFDNDKWKKSKILFPVQYPSRIM